MPPLYLQLLLVCFWPSVAHTWLVVSVTDYGAIGDNKTDCTAAFRSALTAVAAAGGGEVIVPSPGLFKTLPINLTSNTRLTVNGEMWAAETMDKTLWPVSPVVFTYASEWPSWRYQPFIFVPGPDRSYNISIGGTGEINGAGPFFWCQPGKCPDMDETRPHLVSFHNVSGVEISGVTLRNSAFWTLRPIFCEEVWIHDLTITSPWCGGDVPGGPGGGNTDGIDVDSCQNVLIERCDISTGDDHVTILSGAGASGIKAALPTRNVTVRDCVLGTGMGLSVGSSVSGGVSDVLYTRNRMKERPQDWGYGAHIKTRINYGGYIRNIAYIDNDFTFVTNMGFVIEANYQSGGNCNATSCTEISDIVWRNNTGSPNCPGTFGCNPARPCTNITLENINLTVRNTACGWGCTNVSSGTFVNVLPGGLEKACGL